MISVRKGSNTGAFKRVHLAQTFLYDTSTLSSPQLAEYIRDELGFIESLSLYMMDIKKSIIYRYRSRDNIVINGVDAPFSWVMYQVAFALVSGNETYIALSDQNCEDMMTIARELGLNAMITHTPGMNVTNYDYTFNTADWSCETCTVLDRVSPRLSDLVRRDVKEWTYLKEIYGHNVTMIMDEFDLLPDNTRDAFVKERTECLLEEVTRTCPYYMDRQPSWAALFGPSQQRYSTDPLLDGPALSSLVPPYGTALIALHSPRCHPLGVEIGSDSDSYPSNSLSRLQPYNLAFASGGSSGQMKFVYRSTWEDEENARYLAKGLHAQGIRAHDTVMNFLSSGLWGGMHVFNLALSYVGCGVIPTGPGFPDEDTLRLMVQLQPSVVLGTPSYILKLADSLDAQRQSRADASNSSQAGCSTIDIRLASVHTVITGGEQLFHGMQERMRRVLGVQRFLSTGYTTNETGAIGFRCLHLPPTYFHIHENMQYVDIYPPSSSYCSMSHKEGGGSNDGCMSTALQPPGGSDTDRIVTSNLNRLLMPVINYDVGDSGRILSPAELDTLLAGDATRHGSGVCACGRRLRVMQLLGRWDDRVRMGAEDVFADEIAAAIERVPNLSLNFAVHVFHNEHSCRDYMELHIERLEAAATPTAEEIQLLCDQLLESLTTTTKLDWGQRAFARTNAPSNPSSLPQDEVRRHGPCGDSTGWESEGSTDSPHIYIIEPGCLPRNFRTGKIKRIVDHRKCLGV